MKVILSGVASAHCTWSCAECSHVFTRTLRRRPTHDRHLVDKISLRLREVKSLGRVAQLENARDACYTQNPQS